MTGGGLDAFMDLYPRSRPLLVGAQGMPLEEFLLREPATLAVG